MSGFRFKRFEVKNDSSALKVGTDAVVLGCCATISRAPKKILDIGTGTGVIALILAQRLSENGSGFKAVGIDIDGPSAKEAEENFDASPWRESLTALHTPLSDYVPEDPLDLIVSNPPYFEESLKNPDGREAGARHNVSLSFSDIFAFSSEHLSKNGTLSLILPHDSGNKIVRIAASFGLYPFRTINIKTTESKPAKRVIIEFSRKKEPLTEECLILMNGSERSEAYSRLTYDFYL